jgi:hypothetical protein
MSTPDAYDEAAVENAVKKAVTTLGWFTMQIVGCVVTAIALSATATLVSRYFFAGM